MPDINKANRQVCDLIFCDIDTKKPYLKFDRANTTTAGVQGDSVYAMAKGSRKIAFANPLEGTIGVEAQVMPTRFYSLFTGGVMDTTAIYADSQDVTCGTEGELTLAAPKTGTIKSGTVFAYPKDSFGDDETEIEGTFTSNKFTATTKSEIAVGTVYTVGYLVEKTTGVKKVSFTNKNLPKAYYVTMSTLDKDEDERLVPFKIVAYKAQAQRNFELSFSSEGDPATVSATFDLLEDKDGNIIDMIEITDEAE